MKFALTTKLVLIVCVSLLFNESVLGQEKNYTANRTDVAPRIDGYLDDTAWNLVDWGNNFIQDYPNNGVNPTYQTQFKILYDDNNLYIGIRMFDDEPENIGKRLSRRDNIDGDWVTIAFDSYNDNLTAYSFGVNAVGVKKDQIIVNDDNHGDRSWDAVYFVKVSIDDKGWVAEYKIPLSQIRFSDIESHNWGLQISRNIFRLAEKSNWQNIPRGVMGNVSNWGNLNGIKGIKPKLDVEIIPYSVLKSENYKPEEGDPYRDGSDFNLSMGVDGKISLSNDFTLNFTVNPDFGQVEADPSEVNLSAFETFFQEKRPFFIEGKNIFSLPLSVGGGYGSRNENLFYSRRVGRRPHLSGYDYELFDNEYARTPDNANILAAFKLSGKTKNGLSIGIMESITPETFAEIGDETNSREETVEPFTSYFLARVQKDYDKGNTTIGGVVTSTNRKLNADALNWLPEAEYTGGLDFTHYWKNKEYMIQGVGFFSHISGSKEAILNSQESSTRYFQRPDVNHISVDPNRTSLSGSGGGVKFGKVGGGHWRYSSLLNMRSPGFESNGLGYIRNTDEIMNNNTVSYQILEPTGIFNSLSISSTFSNNWGFDWKRIISGIDLSMRASLKNKWRFNWNVRKSTEYLNRFELRGGPALLIPASINYRAGISTDDRKKISFGMNVSQGIGRFDSSLNKNISLNINYRASTALSISVRSSINESRNDLQYISTIEHNGESSYLLGRIKSKRFNTSVRINYSITPDLSIQYYGQPFIFNAIYSDFKKVTNSTAENYINRFHEFTPDEISLENGEYVVDADGIAGEDYHFEDPDFNFFQFKSNFVVRWEYLPGSSVYFVWSQARTGDSDDGRFNISDNIGSLFDVYPSNVFLVKFSYRIVI